MKIKYYQIPLSTYTDKQLTMPIVEIGGLASGFCVIICQLHGDEYSSLLIAQNIINNCKTLKLSQLKIGIRIILSANPYGASRRIKNEPVSGANLNRSFTTEILTQKSSVTPQTEIVNIIRNLTFDANFVVDLHDMPGSKLPVSAILTKTNNNRVVEKNQNLINAFGSEIYWEEDFSNKKTSLRYAGTINNFLNSTNIPNFSIETSAIEYFSSSEARIVAQKLLSLCKENKRYANRPIRLIRFEQYAPASGIFIPKIKLLSKLKKDETVGIINTPQKTFAVKASTNGYLIRICGKRYINKGEKILDTGVTK